MTVFSEFLGMGTRRTSGRRSVTALPRGLGEYHTRFYPVDGHTVRLDDKPVENYTPTTIILLSSPAHHSTQPEAQLDSTERLTSPRWEYFTIF